MSGPLARILYKEDEFSMKNEKMIKIKFFSARKPWPRFVPGFRVWIKNSKEKIIKYLGITKEALDKVKSTKMDEARIDQAKDFLDMAERYFSDANHFYKKDDYINAFAAVNYAHGWLDAGARIRLFKVNDSRLFTVDD